MTWKLVVAYLCVHEFMVMGAPGSVFGRYQAHRMYERGEYASAAALLGTLAVEHPTDWRVIFDLGAVAMQQRQFGEAVNHFEHVLRLNSQNEVARDRLARARQALEEEKKRESTKQEQSQSPQESSNQQSSEPQTTMDKPNSQNTQNEQSSPTQPNDSATQQREQSPGQQDGLQQPKSHAAPEHQHDGTSNAGKQSGALTESKRDEKRENQRAQPAETLQQEVSQAPEETREAWEQHVDMADRQAQRQMLARVRQSRTGGTTNGW